MPDYTVAMPRVRHGAPKEQPLALHSAEAKEPLFSELPLEQLEGPESLPLRAAKPTWAD